MINTLIKSEAEGPIARDECREFRQHEESKQLYLGRDFRDLADSQFHVPQTHLSPE